MTRIVILGGPRTGKTTLARDLAQATIAAGYRAPVPCEPGPIFHTDDLIHLGWSEASAAAALWLDEPGPWIIEGVAAVRALRKWRDQHPGAAPPVDRVIHLYRPHVDLAVGQARMAAGHETVWLEVEPWLLKHGVSIQHGAEPAREGCTPAHQHPRLTDAP